MKNYFPILKLSRDDFKAKGFDASKVTDKDMQVAANKIGNILLDGGDFWLAVEFQAQEMGLESFIDKIEDKLTECDCLEQAEEALESFGTLKFCDEKIDDGVTEEDADDTYVMLRSYDLETANGTFYVKLYYGDSTHELGCFDVQQQD